MKTIYWVLIAAAATIVVSYVGRKLKWTEKSRTARAVANAWMALARGLAYVNTRVILVLIYLLLVGPLKIGSLLLGKDLLRTSKRRLSGETSWVPFEYREREYRLDDWFKGY